MTIAKLIEMGYIKVGEVDGMELWSNLHSKSENHKEHNGKMGFIFQFNLKLQEKAIGQILVTKEVLDNILGGIEIK